MAVMGFRDPAAAKTPSWRERLMTGILGPGQNYGGLLSAEDQRSAQQQGLLALGAQLMAAGGPSSQPTSFGQALAPAIQAGQQAQRGYGTDMLQGMLLKTKLQKAGQVNQPSDVKSYEYAKSNGYAGTFADWKRIAAAQATTPAEIQSWEMFKGLPPEEQQKWIDFKRNSQPYQVVDVGGGKQLLNKSQGTLSGVTTAEQEAAGAAQVAGATTGARATSEATTAAKLDLPRLEQNTQQALETIQQLKKHPGLPYITGAYSLAPVVPGTQQAGADALAKQIQGKTFLEAFSTLRGGGSITETEGTKAEAAIARLQRSQNRREYVQALTELEGVMTVGLERARKKAGGGSQSRSREDILKQYGVP